MGVRYDAARIEVDWLADFVGWRTLKLNVKFTGPDDPLLIAILARQSEELEKKIVASKTPTNADADIGIL